MNDRTFHASGAQRLDDPERRAWLPPAEVIAQLKTTPGMTVADIGAGTGYFSLPLAAAVGPSGKVVAVDFQKEMLEHIRSKLAQAGAPRNVELASGEASATGLDGRSADLVFIANVWHELDGQEAVLEEMQRILRPGGRIALLDWRSDCAPPPGPPAAHRIGMDRAAGFLAAQGWTVESKAPSGKFSYLILAHPGTLAA